MLNPANEDGKRLKMLQSIENVLQVALAGVLIGVLYGLMCVGLGLIFGVMRIINFAQGEFLMLGMYATLFFGAALGGQYAGAWTPFISAILIIPLIFGFGILLYWLSLNSLSQKRDLSEETRHSAQLVITLGVSLILSNGALMLFGTTPKSTPTEFASSAVTLGPLFGDEILLFINKARLIAAGLALLAVVGVVVLMSKTRLGRSVRAAADDANAAMYCGINIRSIYMITFGLGAAITAVGGGLTASLYSFQPYVGFDFIIIMYAGVVLGGVGSITGSFFGGCLVGFVQQISALVIPQQLQNATIFVVLLLVLMLCPQGLFGKRAERV
ncbi:MAG: branched-chain amino acid ABC transporter permease [Pseudorhodoplanes sp.]|uniref:branched-chain amino acid ABC transporter permease n=1 Tax=Pseudorhodoplanes sp. TaxID=1934341 RepID=UPI003D0E9412